MFIAFIGVNIELFASRHGCTQKYNCKNNNYIFPVLFYKKNQRCKYEIIEDHSINPQYPYALTKRLGEELVEHWGQIYKIPFISLRFFGLKAFIFCQSPTFQEVS